jgi:hypothetical protein
MSAPRTDYLTTEEAAAYLRLQPSTLAIWRCKKKGPKYSKLGSRVMYDQQELETWFISRSVHTTDTAPQLRSGK